METVPDVPDVRRVPLYTVAEAARVIDVPTSTFHTWLRGYVRRPPGRRQVVGRPIIHAPEPVRNGEPSVSFTNLVEAYVLAAIRKRGIPLQRIRPALERLKEEIGLEHALASRRLYTAGAEILFDYAEREGDENVRELVEIRHGQRVFHEVIERYLVRIEFASDDWATRIFLPQYERARVIVDPYFQFGQPCFERGRAKIQDVLERFWAGESLEELSKEFGPSRDELEDAIRVASRRAA